MADTESGTPFGDRLQAQETRVGEAQLAACRRSLDERLALASRQERRMRAALFILLAIVALGMLLSVLGGQLLPALFPKLKLAELMQENTVALIAGVAAMIIFVGSGFSLPPLVLLYFLRYRRGLQQIQQDQVMAVVLEMQREIAELRASLGRRAPGGPGAPESPEAS